LVFVKFSFKNTFQVAPHRENSISSLIDFHATKIRSRFHASSQKKKQRNLKKKRQSD
jgi:hypothetical protein